MLLYTYIGTIILSSISSFILYRNKNNDIDGIELLIFNIFSLIPILNLFVVGNSVHKTISNYQSKKLRLKEQEEKINTLFKCISCEVYVRKAYIENYSINSDSDFVINTCPVCKGNSGFQYITKSEAEKIELSKKIPEQQYLTLKDYNVYKKQIEEEQKKVTLQLEEAKELDKLLELQSEEEVKKPEYVIQETIYEEIKKKNLNK